MKDRIIKFRIFNPEEKKMVESGATPMMLHSFFEYTARFNTQYKMEYQQFTGLTDKLGKEVYEGDIMKSDWYEDRQRLINSKVYFSNGRFSCRGLKYDLYDMPELEVIGNIYENPNLIK